MSDDTETTREHCATLDRDDPLADFRAEFELPDDLIYLVGNSLGVLPRRAADRVHELISQEWGQGLVGSWNDAGWFTKPTTVGDRVAPLIGAQPGEVVIGDSTSAGLFQAAVTAARLRPGRDVIVSEADSFPTDLYILESVQRSEGLQRRLIHDETDDGGPHLGDVLDDRVAAVVLTHVNYRTGRMYDLEAVTRQVQDAGALMIWDLCHSVGAVPVDLTAAGADLAVGCTYKYLNGGPGSPSFLYCAARHQGEAQPPLTGWQGHARPFEFSQGYVAAPGITRFRVGTPQLISMRALEASLDVWERVDLAALRKKSLQLTDLFIELVAGRSETSELEIVTPREHAVRGSQVALRHAESAFPMMQALIERGVVGDFRAPDLLRFGFAPLYTRFVDVWDAVEVLAEVLKTEVWRDERYQRRGAVT